MLNDKVVLCTGGTGSFGRAFARRISENYKPNKIIIFSRDEFKQSEMAKEFDCKEIRFFIGDVRDKDRLYRAFDEVDYVIHAAALKQVPALEYNPTEAVKTNVTGAMNIVEAAIERGVKTVVNLSSDKAVEPINLYGATKMCAEKLFTAANEYAGHKTKFCSVRYGNVIGSRGSVIPLFLGIKEYADSDSWGKNPTFPITDERMTRFWLTLVSAVNIVLFALENTQGGEIFVPRIPSMKIVDVAKAIDPNGDIQIAGIRPGEKLHETLISEGDTNVKMVDDGQIIDWQGEYRSDTNTQWLSAKELRMIIGNDSIMTSNERAEITREITKNIKEPISETLRKVRSGEW